MEILLIESDHLIRDQIKVGLQQFPEFTITCGEGYGGINLLRQRRYDLVYLGVRANSAEARRTLEYLRSFEQSVDVVVVTAQKTARDLQNEKSRLNIWSFLSTPVQVTEFFRLVSRIRERLHAPSAAAAAGSPPLAPNR